MIDILLDLLCLTEDFFRFSMLEAQFLCTFNWILLTGIQGAIIELYLINLISNFHYNQNSAPFVESDP